MIPLSAAIVISFTSPAGPPMRPLLVTVPNPTTLSGAELKLRILQSLPASRSRSSLRLIFSGSIINDADTLPHRAFRRSAPAGFRDKGKDHGEPARVVELKMQCLIGTSQLSDHDWDLFRRRARGIMLSLGRDLSSFWPGENVTPADFGTSGTISGQFTSGEPSSVDAYLRPRERPTARGFDRLLETGCSVEDVNQMRIQFQQMLAQTSSQAELATGPSLWDAEERWLGSVSGSLGLQHRPSTGPGYSSLQDGDGENGVDPLNESPARQGWQYVVGSLIGFMWPFCVLLFASDLSSMFPPAIETGIYIGAVFNVILAVLSELAPSM